VQYSGLAFRTNNHIFIFLEFLARLSGLVISFPFRVKFQSLYNTIRQSKALVYISFILFQQALFQFYPCLHVDSIFSVVAAVIKIKTDEYNNTKYPFWI
jgi:hypothetical protein